ncbi:MAG: RES domain-containing protein [Mesorhizobium sp.]|nr:RES family NAD+ phosphorylase [Mesorhizobium sp.]RWF23857.1 MAG: RES domain-containing protein [Mesorhizobium sp.]
MVSGSATHPNDYGPSQVEGRGLRAAGSDGLTWNSVRTPGGSCIGAFWPDVASIPKQGRHYCYHWNGSCVDFVRRYDTSTVLAVS